MKKDVAHPVLAIPVYFTNSSQFGEGRMKAIERFIQKYRHIATRLELSGWKDPKADILRPANEGLRHEEMAVSSSHCKMQMIQTFLLLLLSDFIDQNSQDITSQPRY